MTINIRDIQHYLYCPRRFALLVLNQDWEENAFVVKANLMHDRVHSGDAVFTSPSKKVLSSVAVYHDELDLYGVTDCIEFEKNKTGSCIAQLDGNYQVKIIEYKPRQPKNAAFLETDAIQVFAQKLCADAIWNCQSDGYIYYSDVRRRVKLPFDTQFASYQEKILRLLEEMRGCLESRRIPPKGKKQYCGGCSLKDCCMPIASLYPVKKHIMGGMSEE